MRVLLALMAMLAAAPRPSCARVTITVVPNNHKQSTNGTHGPLPCHGFYAYCRRPYNSSRPGLGRLEGDQALAKEPQALEDKHFRFHRCFCDLGCRKYGDCCLDAITDVDPSSTLGELEDVLVARAEEEPLEWECHTIPSQEVAIYMIGSCPPRFGNSVILNRCQRRVPHSDYGYVLDLPVLSQKTNLTYVNVYCALCNDDTELFQWGIQIYCPDEYPNCTQEVQYWRYLPGEKYWSFHPPDNGTYFIKYAIQNLDKIGQKLYEEFGFRKCRKDVISSCPVSWMGSKEEKLCRSYSLIVKASNKSLLYKNEYCAICNGESVNHLLCPEVVHKPPVVGDPPTKRTHSYAVLLDFMGQGGQVGEAGVCGIDGLICGFGELCDQLHKKCRVYTCGRMYHMDADGQCVENDDNTEAMLSDLPYLDSDCPKLFITKDRFVRHINNSVYIKALNQLYNSSNYEVVNSSAILICTPFDTYFSWKFSDVQSILSKVCISLSLLCLAAHIVIHIVTPPLLNLPGKNLLCLSIALFVAQICFEYGIGATSSKEFCIAIGLLIHFGFLSTFMWMNVMAVDVFRTFATTSKMRSHGSRKSEHEFSIYSLYAWSTALFIVLMAFTNDFYHWMPGYEPMYGDSLCWINNRQGLSIFFAMPLAIILVANIILFTMSVTAICRTRLATKFARKTSSTDDTARVFLYVKLALIMGLTWIFGFVAALANAMEIWYIFILLNCLQGAFIFIAFSCKKSVFRMMPDIPCKRFCHCKRIVKSTNTCTSESEQRPSLPSFITYLNDQSAAPETVS